MQKSPITATTPTPESERIGLLIDQTGEHIVSLSSELREIDQRITSLAQQETLDQQVIGNLRARKVAIVDDLELHGQRLSGLKDRKAEAERQEAQARVGEIEAAAERLREQGATLLSRYRGALSEAEQAVQAIGDLQRQIFVLIHEAQYWQALHNLPAHNFTRMQLPEYSDLQMLNGIVPHVPRKATEHSSEWSRKLTRLKSQREQKQQEPAPVQSHTPEPRPEPVRVSFPARLDHSGDEKLNQLQELLRG
jgi:chromosome segregation ATPase